MARACHFGIQLGVNEKWWKVKELSFAKGVPSIHELQRGACFHQGLSSDHPTSSVQYSLSQSLVQNPYFTNVKQKPWTAHLEDFQRRHAQTLRHPLWYHMSDKLEKRYQVQTPDLAWLASLLQDLPWNCSWNYQACPTFQLLCLFERQWECTWPRPMNQGENPSHMSPYVRVQFRALLNEIHHFSHHSRKFIDCMTQLLQTFLTMSSRPASIQLALCCEAFQLFVRFFLGLNILPNLSVILSTLKAREEPAWYATSMQENILLWDLAPLRVRYWVGMLLKNDLPTDSRSKPQHHCLQSPLFLPHKPVGKTRPHGSSSSTSACY